MTGVTEMTMKPAEAREAYLEYRQALKGPQALREQAEMDRALMRGYKALAAGQRVVDLHVAMRAAGLGDDLYPRLAICRAHEQRCTVQMYQNGGASFHAGDNLWNLPIGRLRCTRMPMDTFDRWTWPARGNWSHRATAIVPIIPAKHRPKTRLENFHILWEAEWRRVTPVDPMLLRHLDGSLYVVLASWDLTPIERAVLGRRLTE